MFELDAIKLRNRMGQCRLATTRQIQPAYAGKPDLPVLEKETMGRDVKEIGTCDALEGGFGGLLSCEHRDLRQNRLNRASLFGGSRQGGEKNLFHAQALAQLQGASLAILYFFDNIAICSQGFVAG